jgi:adenylate cyclase
MPPDNLVESLNRYFAVMVDIIFRHHGIVDKYIGDAIMAFFGAPIKREDDHVNAVLAAVEMSQALQGFNEGQRKRGQPELQIGVGLNYGVVSVGNVGAVEKMDYTVVGDVVNLASTLTSLTRAYAVPILAPGSIASLSKGGVHFRTVDRISIDGEWKGTLHHPATSLGPEQEKAWQLHDRAVTLYYEKRFKDAEVLFEQVSQMIPGDSVSKRYLRRCKQYTQSPPTPEWQGYVPIVSTGPAPLE